MGCFLSPFILTFLSFWWKKRLNYTFAKRGAKCLILILVGLYRNCNENAINFVMWRIYVQAWIKLVICPQATIYSFSIGVGKLWPKSQIQLAAYFDWPTNWILNHWKTIKSFISWHMKRTWSLNLSVYK